MEVVNQNPLYKQQLPNSSTTLVMGILSVVLGCFLGLIFGIIGLVMSKDGLELYKQNPAAYTGYGALNAGRVLCIIGIVLSSISYLFLFFWIVIIGGILGTIAGLGGAVI